MSIEIVKAGLQTTLQDAGRPGFAHLGVGRAGAFDGPALRLANAVCNNIDDACALEITLLGPILRFATATTIAVTGAPISVRIDDTRAPQWAPLRIRAGATVALGSTTEGCRSYLAVHGGFDVAPVLGSRSSDVNAGIGVFDGRPLRAGDTLPTASLAEAAPAPARTSWSLDPFPWFGCRRGDPLRLLPGRHLDALTAASREALFTHAFTVRADSNRVGLRLAGPHLALRAPAEMASEGCVPGLLQLPPSGQPIAFGPEGPVSGGYPRLGQIIASDLPRLAQLRPGDALRFAPCTSDAALVALRVRERALALLEARIRRRIHATT